MNVDLKDLKGLPPLAWGYAVMIILASIAPGMLMLFLFREGLFVELDTMKLVFLSMSITIPVWALNSFLVSLDKGKIQEGESSAGYFLMIFSIGAILSLLPLYSPIVIKLLFNIDRSTGIWIGTITELIIMIMMWIVIKVDKKRRLEEQEQK